MILFDVVGKFASFKKFYTNSSSMSYIFPPRTTIEGIIASIMGYDFDSYYEKLNFKKSLISVSLKSKIRTYIGTLNYMKIINSTTFRNNMLKKKGYEYTQIPFEMILPENFLNNIIYRIYFKSDDSIMSKLEDKIINKKPVYPITLGNANMLATLNFVANAETNVINSDEFINVVSPSPLKYVNDIYMKDDIHIQKDIFPVSFDKNRYPRTMEYIFEREGKQYKIKTDKTVLSVKYNNINENILFPEMASNEFLFA